MEDYEAILLVKQEVFVFKIPPRTSNRGYRAADWNLSAPDWTGRMRLLAKGTECILKLEDKVSGELFAKCPVDTYPGIAIEAVSDSSRYFVVRIQDDSGRAAFIGVGFADRSDSFDLNVALQDHFKWVKQSQEIEKEGATEEAAKPRLDLSFKAGETIKINMKIGKKDGDGASKPKTKPLGGYLIPATLIYRPPVSSNWVRVVVRLLIGYYRSACLFCYSLSSHTTDTLNFLFFSSNGAIFFIPLKNFWRRRKKKQMV
uniref:EOG090X0G5X n=1 Tax=Daphnia carinata TaxID=120202 RepID=A0A4Y7LZQ1_9CRUS|nr:EOG090X0G5X [Daphnia carinata]